MRLNKLYTFLNSKGYKGKIISAAHIPDLINDIKRYHESQEIYPDLYDQYRNIFEFQPDAKFSPIESIIIIAVPVPRFRLTFQWKDKDLSLVIPPTYLYGGKIIEETQGVLEQFFTPFGYKIAYARVPFKTLAVRSGLAKFGRNNITYIPEMGSFYRLCAFYSDFPLEYDNWNELKMMDECQECNACRLACPTKAISNDRFLLHVERCITFHNEQPGDIPFPKWIQSKWHNCIVGCLYCQKVCPANKKVRYWTENGPIFTHEETKLILSRTPYNRLPIETKKKLNESELDEYLEILPRNIRVFLSKSQDS